MGRFCLTVGLFFVMTAGALRADERPNIVLLMASGQRAGMAGFEGNTHLKTPHLDALAADAAVFTRAYTPSPYAAQNLASVVTGLYPHAFRVTEDGVSLLPGTDTLVARLRRAGYTCVLVGQWGLDSGDEAGSQEELFDHVAVCMGECPWMDSEVLVNGRQEKIEGYLPDWISEHAVEFLSAGHDGPSFLWVTFRGPRPPVVDPPGAEGGVDPDELPLPESLHYEREGLPAVLANVQASERFLHMNETQIRACRAQYANATAYLDTSVGRILEAIEQGESDRPTVVIFASDGGFLLG